MFKFLLTIFLLLIVSFAAKSQTYCTPASSICSNNDVITRVKIGSLDNPSGCSANGYIDYSGTLAVTPLYIGISTPIAVTVGHRGREYVAVWIDYDQDGSFETNEYSLVGLGDGVTINNLINIPANATPGNTRMRVRLKYNSNPPDTAACTTFVSGETEDYTVNLVTPSGCANTPVVGQTASVVSAACAIDSIYLSVNGGTSGFAGLTYQWQSSRDSIVWEDLAGKTNVTALVYQDSTRFYRRAITCSVNTSFSLPVKVRTKTLLECYCKPTIADCSQNDLITMVSIGTFTKTSLCSPAGYMDYTNLGAATVSPGPVDVSVTVGPGGNEQVSAWIDYNHNGTFDKAEYTYIGSGNGATISKQIIIPSDALWGTTRMRVRVRYNILLDSANACTSFPYGETEDYLVNIAGAAHCIPDGLSDCTGGNAITRVVFGTIDNTSGCSPNGYSNFSSGALSATVAANSFVPVTIETGCDINTPVHVGVWIDFDQDSIFERSEFTMIRNDCTGPLLDSISIPCNALAGTTIMRVRATSDYWFTSSDACIPFINGETEDYKVIIQPDNCPVNTWTGLAGNTNWEDAGNWSCQQVPGVHSIVMINSGTVTINSNVTVYSLTVNPAATLTVEPTYNLIITE